MGPSRGRLLRIALLLAGLTLILLAVLSPELFDSSGFMPHGHCYLWRTDLIAVHATSDLLIGLSYTAISLTLVYLVAQARSAIPFHWMPLAFGAFIIACGATHFMEVWTLWHPDYWLAGNIKMVTALASVTTAVALPPLVPKALALVRAQEVAETRRVQLDKRTALLAQERAARTDADAARAETETVNQRLRDSEARVRTILDTIVDAVITIDERGIIESFNPAAERLFGYAPAEVIGQNIGILMPEPYRGEHATYIANYLRTGHAKVIGIGREVVGQRRDGSTVPVELAVSEVHSGTRRLFAGIVRDISERQRAEVERERLLALAEAARDAAERTSRAKDEFLATVSHELRAPLSPIVAWSHMLQTGSLDAEKSRKAADAIARNVRAQVQLIDDLLDVSRIVSGKLRVNMQSATLAPVIEAAVDSLRPTADAKGVHLDLDLGAHTGPVYGDPPRLRQIVWNLVGNAIKFTPRNGHVSIRLQPVGANVELTVSDTGQGIEPTLLPHLFERFWQAETGSARQQGGLGLGLAIVRHLTELHGGTVTAHSDGVGRGAILRVTLPLMASAATMLDASTAGATGVRRGPTSLSGVRVLVVDDEPDANEAVQLLLASRDAEVRVAASAAQAFEIVGRWRPDVLVCDIAMPGEDGYALIQQLRRRPLEDGGDLPAIALTAYAGEADRARILSAGFQMHMVKPADPVELTAAVAALAQRRGA